MSSTTEQANAATCGRDGVTDAQRERAGEFYRRHIERMVADMARDGLVLTVEQVPMQPLAMGHYTTTVSVRLARRPA